ncbi:MAG: hypothetical protein R2860_13260 [Desulfobacterales bacterium]
MKRPGDEELRPASRAEYEKIIRAVGSQQDVRNFQSAAACDKSIFEIARLMEKSYQGSNDHHQLHGR